jgi:hypothetical protein
LRTISPGNPLFGLRARAEKKCAASPGGTFFILLPGLGLSTRRCRMAISRTSLCPKSGFPFPDACAADSNLPQVVILKENLLVAGTRGLQTLAVEPLNIVAFA